MRKVFSSLRARVLLLIAIPFAVMLGMTLYHTLSEREERLAQARTRVLDTARAMAGEQQRIIAHVNNVLASAALLPEVRRGVASAECSRALVARHQQEPNLNGMLLALPNGAVICSAIPMAGPISIADRDFFKAAIQTREFSVGGYVVSRTIGRPGIGFGYPVLDEAGVPRAVVATTLSIAWLEQELAKAQLPEGSRVVVVDGKGLVLARHPDPEKVAGSSAAELPLLRRILAKGDEGTEEDIGPAGVRQIFGFVPLHRTASGQAYLWVAIPKDVVVGPAEREFVVSLLVALALLVLTFGVAWLGSESFFVRRIAALTGATKELGEGNLATRAGFKANGDEIGQLAQSFDRMAEELQTKAMELSRTVRALRVLSAGNRTMLRAKEGEEHLLEAMCRAIGEAGGYRMVWAGFAENDTEKSIRPAAHWGSVAEGYFENARFTWGDTESGQTPPGNAIRTARPAVARDIQRENGPQSWRDGALRCSLGSCVALPLQVNDQVIGALAIYAEGTDAFGDEEVGLLSETAADLSFGIASQRSQAEQVRMSLTLKTAEERFRAAAEASLDAFSILRSVRDKTGQIVDFEFTDINARAEGLLGMAREKVIGQKLCDLLPIRRASAFFNKYAQVVATGTPLEEEFPVDTPAIKARWLRQQVVRVDDGIAVSSRDITLWRTAGDQLRESEETLRTIATSAQDAILMLDNEGNITLWNAAAEKIFGYSSAEALGANLHILLAPSRFHEAHRTGFHHFKSTGEGPVIGKTLELAALRKDGTEFPIELSLSAVRLKDKWHAAGIVRDITERKRAAEAIEQSEKRFHQTLDDMMEGCMFIGFDWTCLYLNETSARHSHQERKNVIGRTIPEAYPGVKQSELFASFQRVMEKRLPERFETAYPFPDGSLGWYEFSVQPVQEGIFVLSLDITARKQGELELERANRALRTLSACNEALVRAGNEPELLNSICRLIVETGGYRVAWVGVPEEGPARKVRAVAQYGFEEGYLEAEKITWGDTEHGQGPTGLALRTGEIQVNQNFMTTPQSAPWRDAALHYDYQSCIALPLKGSAGIFGVLTIDAKEPDAFNEAEVALLRELAEDLAFGIESLRTKAERDRIAFAHQHHEQILRESLEDSIKAIANTVEMRDPYTAGHQRRVADLAGAIAVELGLSEDTIHGIRLASGIHDLGKIRVPAEILSKPSRLTSVELELIKAHPQGAYDILKDVKFPWPIADIVLQHHEKLDGSGYPQGLKGDQILLGARIIAVADVVEAMASHRPYRPALGIDAALTEIEKGRGTAFDPAVVDACLKLFREGQFAFQG